MIKRGFLCGMVLAVVIMTAGCKNGSREYEASGTFEATEIIISAEGTGRIERFDLDEGDIVEEGQFVGNIDNLQLILKKKQLGANIKGVETKRPDIAVQIAGIQQQLATANYEKERIEKLVKADAATQKQLDDAVSQVLILQKQLRAQKESLEKNSRGVTEESTSLELQIAQLNDQIEKCRIYSPIRGTVLVKYCQAGEFATVGKALFKIADIEKMFLRAYMTSDQLTKIKLGQEIDVYSDQGRDGYKKYKGKIVWISGKAEFTPKTVQTQDERANLVYAVKTLVKNDGYIKIGMYGKLKFKG